MIPEASDKGSFMAGYLCLMPTAFFPLQHNTKSNTHRHFIPLQHNTKSVTLSEFRASHFTACLYSFMPSAFFVFEMPTALMSKIPTKTCRGKVTKEKLKSVKTGLSLFIHNSSFSESLGFSLPYLTFDCAKGYVSSPQTLPFTLRNITFRATKPYLSQIRIL